MHKQSMFRRQKNVELIHRDSTSGARCRKNKNKFMQTHTYTSSRQSNPLREMQFDSSKELRDVAGRMHSFFRLPAKH